jgi:hypothetical protein
VSKFYRDYGHPTITRLACKAAEYRQHDPLELVPEHGGDGADMIPIWWKYQDQAANFIAMMTEWEQMKAEVMK